MLLILSCVFGSSFTSVTFVSNKRFRISQLCRTNICVIAIVKISNRSIQIRFKFPQRTSLDSCKVYRETLKKEKYISEKNRAF